MYRERVPYYRKLEQLFESKLLVYITSDRPNMAAQIAPDVIEYFIDHLDKMRSSCDKISLFLYTIVQHNHRLSSHQHQQKLYTHLY